MYIECLGNANVSLVIAQYQKIKIWTILINVVTVEVTNVSLMFKKVKSKVEVFIFAPYQKMKNQAFKK